MYYQTIFGISFIVLGFLMAIFSRPIGIYFCRIGRRIWREASIRPFSQGQIETMYDEEKVPSIMRILGFVFIAQGVLFFCIDNWG